MPKDKFKALDSEFKDTIANMSEEEIRATVAKVGLNQVELMKAKEDDQDLAEKKFAASEAGAIYRDGTKFNKLRIEFCHQVLGDRGKDTGEFDGEKAQAESDAERDRREDETE
jgi:hypothetical protein